MLPTRNDCHNIYIFKTSKQIAQFHRLNKPEQLMFFQYLWYYSWDQSQAAIASASSPWFLALPLRFQIGVVSISLWGTRRLSRFVSLAKLWTFSLAISASSSGVISLKTTVSLHSALTLTPLLPFAWYDTLFLKNPLPTNASAVTYETLLGSNGSSFNAFMHEWVDLNFF